MIQARTGSGKTGVFLLPMLAILDRSPASCQALILVPMRKLARRSGRKPKRSAVRPGLRTVAVYGGVGYAPQTSAIKAGAQIVVGTPGLVLDHLLKRTFSLEHLKMLIYDEADRMLSMGFYPDMREAQDVISPNGRYIPACSATFSDSVMRTAREFIRDGEFPQSKHRPYSRYRYGTCLYIRYRAWIKTAAWFA